MSVTLHNITGGGIDDLPDYYPPVAFQGDAIEDGTFNGQPKFSIAGKESYFGSLGVHHYWLASINRWCLSYGCGISDPQPNGFISADENIEGTYTAQGIWADNNAHDVVVGEAVVYGGYWWETARNSFELRFPPQYFQVGYNDFTVNYIVKATYDNPSGIDYTFFTLSQGNGPGVFIGLDPDSGPLRIWAWVRDSATGTYKEVHLDNFDWNGKILSLTMAYENGGMMRFYINNVLIGSVDVSAFSGIAFQPDVATINHGGNPTSRPGNAVRVDQLRFYNGVALTQAQINAETWGDGFGIDVNKTSFASLCDYGFFTEFRDNTGSGLYNGTWADGVSYTILDLDHPEGMGLVLGGVPFNEPMVIEFDYHRIYRGQDGNVDYLNPVAIMGLNESQISIPGQALPPNTIWYYLRRQVAPCGLESPDSPACIVRIDSAGDMVPVTPNQPLLVTAIRLAGGKFLIRWRYTPISQEIVPTGFHIYADSGSGFNFAEPTGTISYKLGGRGEFKWESDSYPHGHRIKFCVRAYALGKGETLNTDYVAAVADAVGPEAITDVFATVEQLP